MSWFPLSESEMRGFRIRNSYLIYTVLNCKRRQHTQDRESQMT